MEEIWVKVMAGQIMDKLFWTDGCWRVGKGNRLTKRGGQEVKFVLENMEVHKNSLVANSQS